MIKILCISDSDKHFDSAIQEYKKRLTKNIEIRNIKPSKNGSKQQIINQDTENINKQLKKDDINIMLSLKWEIIDSIDFKKYIQKAQNSSQNIVFVIWGAFGLDESKLININKKICFGHMTLPHGLMKLVILEQVYRGLTIISGKKYHY